MSIHKLSSNEKFFTGYDLPEGDIVEFGVYEGGSAIELSKLGRRVWAFDTFNGMPHEEYNDSVDHDYPGKFKPSNTPWEAFKEYPNIAPIQGRFCNTFPCIPHFPVALAHFDCDLEASYQQAFGWLTPRLQQGSVLVFDDYEACKGAKIAVDRWVADTGQLWAVPGRVVVYQTP